jgi:hypothetical protein
VLRTGNLDEDSDRQGFLVNQRYLRASFEEPGSTRVRRYHKRVQRVSASANRGGRARRRILRQRAEDEGRQSASSSS